MEMEISVPKSISEQGTISNHFPKIPKGINGRTKSAKVHSDVGNDLQSLPKGSQRIIWTMGRQIGVSIAGGLDVPKFLNGVPNFLKDVPRVPKFVSEQGTTSNYFLKIPKEINKPWIIIQRSWQLMDWMYKIVLMMCQIL